MSPTVRFLGWAAHPDASASMAESITTLRLAEPADLDVIKQLTEAAYAPYTALLGALPLPVTENLACDWKPATCGWRPHPKSSSVCLF
jgi:hypothetical protein